MSQALDFCHRLLITMPNRPPSIPFRYLRQVPDPCGYTHNGRFYAPTITRASIVIGSSPSALLAVTETGA